ncbi:MAG: SPFH domain-containing protein [Acidobacteriota bacterium]|jgi:membrane protease subunit (stomatin/prohibitin family)|nr:SPFH domain-containing protein [Acidobacteriota bacterium]
MGLIKAGSGALGGALADSWREYFYCEALDQEKLVTKGEHRVGGRSSNRKKTDNIISNGSIIAVNDGQCMMIVDQGQVVELCATPGEFIYDFGTEPSIFYGSLSESIKGTFRSIGRRFTVGGEPGKDQRIYFFNTKELMGNKYGTANPVPFRVVDSRVGLDVDIAIRCHGEYSFKIDNPMLFYKNVCGNVAGDYMRDTLSGQLKTELLTALQPAFAKLSALGVRYSEIPGHTTELSNALNEVLSEKWGELRGLKIVSFGVSSLNASEEDEKMIKELQRNAAFRDPTLAAAHLVGAQAQAMQDAAKNEGTGPVMGFMGMGMAQTITGGNIQNLYAMGAGQQAAQPAQTPPAASAGWACACGHAGNSGKFCAECGKPRPVPATGWNCTCGAVNQGKFCQECGKPKPHDAPLYRCDKCGWNPPDPHNPPKFCPECGDVFDANDVK